MGRRHRLKVACSAQALVFGQSFGATSECIAGFPTLKFSPRTRLDVGFLAMVAVCKAVHPL
ncbi:hypothetical protein TIFTF001_027313 [Ficus carica]|uniref:Uncharacterized protein n=1 Tax=Ficus carica TaxID=3494 RepID=A0AA88DP02_FICCA|nr:hypothetical protein TIFTF001_027313 [Ficus carica]